MDLCSTSVVKEHADHLLVHCHRLFKSARCVAKFVYFNEPIQKSTVTGNVNLIRLELEGRLMLPPPYSRIVFTAIQTTRRQC